MKHYIEIGYAFRVLSAPSDDPDHRLLGSVFITFHGLFDLGDDRVPSVNVPFALVPPRLRQLNNRGLVRVIESNPVTMIGEQNPGMRYVVFESIIETGITVYEWGIEPLKDHARERIRLHVIPYMTEVLGLQPMGEAPYIGVW